ncbi:MAG: dNTP triphosphohydrolase [Bryobacteraceae bacterium]
MSERPAPAPLAHLRFPVEESLGRRYPEAPHPYRTDFRRDRDRVVHARAFRRLENKTQVFSSPVSDHFRNRLTHTIEVSQLARTVAAALGLDEDLTEALALAHDIGHPPFAHSGEVELDRQMRRFGDRFEHNTHALRIVESFEHPYARFPGLNLTFEVREGMVKHSRELDPADCAGLEEYLPGLRPPAEAQLIDLADEIAYDCADLDDGLSAAMFELADVVEAVPLFADLIDRIEFQFPGAAGRVRFLEALRLLIDGLVSGLIEGTVAAAAGIADHQGVRAAPVRIACFTPVAAEAARQLKRFLHERLYEAPALQLERTRAVEMIDELFRLFLEHPEKMPNGYLARTKAEPAHRVVCDYIAGMTDGFFRRAHAQATGAGRPGPNTLH